jgi:hypothetical protein
MEGAWRFGHVSYETDAVGSSGHLLALIEPVRALNFG